MQEPCSLPRPPVSVLAYERLDPRDQSLDWLRESGVEIRFGRAQIDPAFKRYSEEELIAEAQGCQGLLGSSSARITRKVIEALPDLRFISKLGIGTDMIDLVAATERGIVVSNTPDPGAAVAVAEHAIALMLGLAKRLNVWTPGFMQAGGWRGSDLATSMDGLTVGIVGFGRIGQAVAQRLAGWNVRLLAFDPYAATATEGVALVELETLLAQSDIVTLHCAATAENHHLINEERLASMKSTALLVNTGRGTLVDTAALTASLEGGRLAGAGLDVFEEEPPPGDHPLFRLPNVLVTPHVASRSLRAFLDSRWRAARNMQAMVSGRGEFDRVNPSVERQGVAS